LSQTRLAYLAMNSLVLEADVDRSAVESLWNTLGGAPGFLGVFLVSVGPTAE
jgi:hypothetical protein